MNNYVIIMAGGIGSRFWPFSRTNFPKQFHDVLGTGKSLLQQTAERFEGVCPPENIYIVTNDIYGSLVKEQLPFLSDDQILLEPCGKNTAPCVAYAAYKIASKDPQANLIISPSDHIILKEEMFKDKVRTGLAAVSNTDTLLTLGIEPNRPDTGYGYIKFEESSNELKKVIAFTEKPNLERATQFLASGDYVWNAGIFIWNASSILKAFEKHCEGLHQIFSKGHYYNDKEAAFVKEAYSTCESISIDYAIMEKADNVSVLLCDIGWSDLGTWKSLYEISEKDSDGNVLEGNVKVYNTQNCIFKTPKNRLVVAEGLNDFIVAEYDNVLMICPKEQEQKVKEFVADLKGENLDEYY